MRFRRPAGLLALPVPERGGKIADLKPFLNVASESDFTLLVGWLVSAFNPVGPFTMLVIHGEQGSAKSTTAKLLQLLIDPNFGELRSEPRETRI
jgi:ABC-type multidrug transport system fused ATPase/permease subunit